jgi:hypothetical protein
MTKTAVSLYFTAGEAQGPGAIAGSAIEARKRRVNNRICSWKVRHFFIQQRFGCDGEFISDQECHKSASAASSSAAAKSGAAPKYGHWIVAGLLISFSIAAEVLL